LQALIAGPAFESTAVLACGACSLRARGRNQEKNQPGNAVSINFTQYDAPIGIASSLKS
jgi:hypothetical protein